MVKRGRVPRPDVWIIGWSRPGRLEVAGLCHSDLSVVNGDRVRPLPMLLRRSSSPPVST